MKISIAMATYNGSQYLQKQLDSFVAQTRLPDEVVIVDDCSTDNTMEIIEEFSVCAPFEVRFKCNKKNLGYTRNFDRALSQTTGDLVFLSDQDDVWFPEKIGYIECFARENPDALVLMNDAALTDAYLNDTGLTKLGQIRSAGFSEANFVMGCCAAVKRDLLELCLPIPQGAPSHDGWIVGIGDVLRRRRITTRVLQYYRRHSQNASQTLVNRTKRVTPWDVRSYRLKVRVKQLLVRGEADVVAANRTVLPLKVLIRDWAENTLPEASEVYSLDLNRFLMESHYRASAAARVQTQRMTIRKRAFPSRLRCILQLWWLGGYRGFSGVKSVVRDLIG